MTTANLGLTEPTVGSFDNTWGDALNTCITTFDARFGNVTAISTTGGTTTLNQAQENVNAIDVSGTLASAVTIAFLTGVGGTWIIRNGTSGAFSLTAKVTGQTGVVIPQGTAAVIWCNGTDIFIGVTVAAPTMASLTAGNAWTPEVTVASATTTDILGAASDFIAISGNTTITSLGTAINCIRFVRATGAFLITYNATSLITPSGQNINTAAGDTFIVISDSSGNARVIGYSTQAFDAIEFVIDGGGAVLTTGLKGYIEVPWNCVVQRVTTLADQSGSVVVDIFKCTYSAFAPGTHPVSSDKITASAPPTVASNVKAQDSTLTGWTTTFSAGDILAFNINSVTTVQRVTVSLRVVKT